MGCNFFANPKENARSKNDGKGDQSEISHPDQRVVNTYQPPATDGYVGSQACAACHQELFESYQAHPMYQSTRKVVDDRNPPPVNELNRYVPGDKRFYSVEVLEDGGMLHREQMLSGEGEVLVDESRRMDWVVGSGKRGKAYLAQLDHLVFMSPLNWYGQDQCWDFAPDYKPDDPRRFSRRAVENCLGCHAGRLNVEERLSNRYQEQVFAEIAIGCERCHGPGEDHIALHEATAMDKIDLDPIVNPAKLSHAQRESLCMQCHLQPSIARRTRYGRSDLDFRPGDVMGDVWAVAETVGTVSGTTTEPVRHVQQLRESLCYQASPQAMDCTSCHDPHRTPSLAERTVFYRQRCFECHTESSCDESPEVRETVKDSCIDCHMPSLDVSGQAHFAQTDHRILRRADQKRERPARPSGLQLIDNQEELFTDLEKQRIEMHFLIMDTQLNGLPMPFYASGRLEQLIKQFPEDGKLKLALGSVAWSKQQKSKAIACYQQAAEHPESAELALANLMQFSYLDSNWEEVLDYSSRLIELDPYVAQAYAIRSDAFLFTNRPDQAIAMANKALEVDPTMQAMHSWFVMAYTRLGNSEEAAKHQAILDKVQAAELPAYVEEAKNRLGTRREQ